MTLPPVCGVDLGTTTLTVALLSAAGEVIGSRTVENPQRPAGADVISRLQRSLDEEERGRLCRLVHETIGRETELLVASHVPDRWPGALLVAGNTAMQTIAADLPVDTLVRPPFRPRQLLLPPLSTGRFGWRRDLPLRFFPQPGGFVGGDLTAFLYGVWKGEGGLFVDVGTNAEIALAAGGGILATSAAAGPAFEGGSLSCGVLHGEGAVTKVEYRGGRVEPVTVGGGSPRGLAGSGAISLLALLVREGVVDRTGRMARGGSPLSDRVVGEGGDARFVLFRDARTTVFLSQEDVRQIQLAVAAIRGGIDVLLEREAVRMEELGTITLTGSFGGGLDPDDLATIGVIDPSVRERVRVVPEGVIRGIARFVGQGLPWGDLEGFARRIRVIPLSGTPRFGERFVARMTFPSVYGIDA